MALDLFARVIQKLLSRAEEARGCSKEREDKNFATTGMDFHTIPSTWYCIRDAVIGKRKVYFCPKEGGHAEKEERLYAPDSLEALDPWFEEHYVQRGTFFEEWADGGSRKICTENPVHGH